MKKLLIVESPTKAKTINKFLGGDYQVLSSFGHLRDLPKKEMGIDFENNFEPTYIVSPDKKQRVTELKKAAKAADQVYLATDEDREGEAIAWHIAEILKLDPKNAKRITFHEITKKAIEKALEDPRTLEMSLVNAQQARRLLDRIVGYELSPFLWQKVRRGLSAGRVQSVAVRLIVERERERMAFKQDEYWTIDAAFEKDGQTFEAALKKIDGKALKKLSIGTEAQAKEILTNLEGATYTVSDIEKKQATRKPPTPLRTSVLQQEANNKLGMSAKQTMTLAQKLYETGRITYMRTDSLNLSDAFLQDAQTFLKTSFGDDYAKGVHAYKTKSKGAQEAHEAIRPTDVNVTPEALKGKIDAGQWKLYDLIWRRTLASQMPSAKIERTGINIDAKQYQFRANGSVITFDGFMKVYRSAKEVILPEVASGDEVQKKDITPTQHFTQPPARYSDASLVKALEEHGIGRPSTYAPTIGTIISRGYVDRDDNKKLFPTDIAMIVNDVLVEHFPTIVDLDFTANMEQSLDDIAEGSVDWTKTLSTFYTPFHKSITTKSKEVSREDVMPARVLGKDPETKKDIIVRTGRYGAYIQLGEWSEEDRKEKKNKPKSISLPKDMHMESITLEDALKLLELPREIGENEAGEMITAHIGPYGPYLRAGKSNASLPEDYNPLTVTLDEAKVIMKEAIALKKKMAEPIATLGEDPNSKQEILVKNGRFGPYVTDGKTNVSIPKSKDPKSITAEEAIEMLEKKRHAPKRGRRAPAKKKKASS